jgi:hypothetical protein
MTLVTPEGFANMLEAQHSVCKVCEKPARGKPSNWNRLKPGQPVNTGRLHVDHCHDTGMVRGLLCPHCNTSLGKLNDDPVLIWRLAAYAEEWLMAKWAFQSVSAPMDPDVVVVAASYAACGAG